MTCCDSHTHYLLEGAVLVEAAVRLHAIARAGLDEHALPHSIEACADGLLRRGDVAGLVADGSGADGDDQARHAVGASPHLPRRLAEDAGCLRQLV